MPALRHLARATGRTPSAHCQPPPPCRGAGGAPPAEAWGRRRAAARPARMRPFAGSRVAALQPRAFATAPRVGSAMATSCAPRPAEDLTDVLGVLAATRRVAGASPAAPARQEPMRAASVLWEAGCARPPARRRVRPMPAAPGRATDVPRAEPGRAPALYESGPPPSHSCVWPSRSALRAADRRPSSMEDQLAHPRRRLRRDVERQRAASLAVNEGLEPKLQAEQRPQPGAVILKVAEVPLQHELDETRVHQLALAEPPAGQRVDEKIADFPAHPARHRHGEALFAPVEQFGIDIGLG